MWPTAVTSFIHVIACHDLLRAQHWNFLSVLKLKSWLNCLSECNGIARTAFSLVSHIICKVDSIKISEIITIRNLVFWNLISWSVVFTPTLGFFKNLSKSWRLTKWFRLWLFFATSLCKHQSFSFLGTIIRTYTILFMTFGQFASISLPS
jgi:hypothetical protein